MVNMAISKNVADVIYLTVISTTECH